MNGFQMRFLNLVHNVSNGMVKAQFFWADFCRKLCKKTVHYEHLTEIIGNFLVRGTYYI